MKPVFSVIIPVYNTNKKLNICISSLLKQTFFNFECILVDDGSTDPLTIQICKNIINKDPRFKYYHKENEGIEKSRIFGVEKSTTSLIIFCDHDDYYEKNAFEILYKNWIQSKADIIVGNCFHQISSRIPFRTKIIGLSSELIIEQNEFLNKYYKNFFGVNLFPVSTWGKLYSKHLFDDEIKTLNFNFLEDIIFNSQVFKRATKIHFIPNFLYTHIYGGLSSKFNPKTVLKGYVTAYSLRNQLLNDLKDHKKINIYLLYEFKNVVNQNIKMMFEHNYDVQTFVNTLKIIENSDILLDTLSSNFEKGSYFKYIQNQQYSELHSIFNSKNDNLKVKFKLKIKNLIKSILDSIV